MRTAWTAVLAMAMVGLGLTEASAQTARTTVARAAAEPQVAEPLEALSTWVPVVAGNRDSLTIAIIAEIERRWEKAVDPADKAFLSQINGHYRVLDSEPLWVDSKGLTREGEALLKELQDADDFGLDPQQFQLPATPVAADIASRAAAEVDLSRSAVEYAWHARGGRVDPSQLSRWLDQKPRPLYAEDVFRAIGAKGSVIAGLRSFHPQHAQFELLRQAYLTARGDKDHPAPRIIIPAGNRIDVGDRDADVSLIRQRLGVPASDLANDDLLDSKLMGAIREYMYDAGYGRKRYVDDDVRVALNRPGEWRSGSGTSKAMLEKYLVNLERWRVAPERFGALHVWNNLPEFLTRVVESTEVVHEERIIIGKPETQTPVFSDTMSHVIFQPEWGVPESIKIRSILPYLRGGDYGVLARRGMSIKDGNRVISPSKYRWSKVDIRNVPIIQGPGPGNPLGKLKFIFPNSHDVYMHDTTDKYLFESSERTFSHGCIRVRNPDRFAEVVLGRVQGWSGADVARQLKIKTTFQVDLNTHIPVHNTYFTMWARPDGSVAQFKDVYSHDKRIADALNGKSISTIAARDPALALKRQNDELRKNGVAMIKPKPRAPKNALASAQPFSPFAKQSLGKPVPTKKYVVSPPKFLWFQQY